MNPFLAPVNHDRVDGLLDSLASYDRYDPSAAPAVHALLRDSYPLVFAKTEQKLFANHGMLLEMPGANVTDPLVFVCCLDGGPSCASCGKSRASSDPKEPPVPLQQAHAIALLEALESLLDEGYRPGGDLLIALSMDGQSQAEGAQALAAHLKARKLAPCFVLDFGGYVTHSAFCTYLPRHAPLALVGISEKGLLRGGVTGDSDTLKGSARGQNPLHRLLRAGARLSRRSRKAALCKSSQEMLLALARHAPLPQRLLVSIPWLTFPLLRFLWRKRAVMRQFFEAERTLTNIACQPGPGGAPSAARLDFCQTALPGQPLRQWKYLLRERVADENLRLRFSVELEHSARSHAQGEAWTALQTAIEILFDQVVIAPCLSPYVTDGRFYTGLRRNVYRFSPFLLDGQQALRGVCAPTQAAMQTAVQFFRQMLSV